MIALALLIGALFGAWFTLLAQLVRRHWRYLAALEREGRRDDGLLVVPAVADGTEPAVTIRRRTRHRRPPDDDRTHELPHLQIARQENHR